MNTSNTCSSCGKAVPADARFCPFCGAESLPKDGFCPACGTVTPKSARFCAACGTFLQESEMHACPFCSHELSENAAFCSSCGVSVKEIKRRSCHKKRKKASQLRPILRSGILLFVSLFLLIAAFLPVVSFRVTETSSLSLEEPIRLRYSAIDLIALSIDAATDLPSDELAEEELAEEIKDLTSEIRKMDLDDLSRSDTRTLERYLRLFIRLTARSEEISLSPSMILAVTVSVLYIVFTILLFALALKQLIRTLLHKSTNERGTVKLFLLSPFFILLTYFSAQGAPASSLGDVSIGMAWSLPALLLACACALFFITERYIFGEKRILPRPLITGAACVLLSMMALCLCFGPVFRAEAEGEFKKSTVTRTAKIALHSGFFQEFELNEKAAEEIEEEAETLTSDEVESYRESLFSGTARDFRDGTQYAALSSSLVLTAFWWYDGGGWALFPFIYYAAFFAALLMAACAWRALVSLYDRPARRSLLALSASALAPLVAYLALDVVFIAEMSHALEKNGLGSSLSLHLAANPVILILLTVLVVVGGLLLPRIGNTSTPSLPASSEPVSKVEQP